MIRPICKDTIILKRKSVPATIADLPTVEDLLDTLEANAERCVGMAANMIGVNKRIIAINAGMVNLPLINPVITKRDRPYEAMEGCLSLPGERRAVRYKSIEVKFLDRNFEPQRRTFTDFPAQIVQHELDHCDGILI